MTDEPAKPPVSDDAVKRALLAKRDDLLAERTRNREQRARLSARDREIDRELADCQAAGRVFGVAIEIPNEPTQDQPLRVSWSAYERALEAMRNRLAHYEGPKPPPVPSSPPVTPGAKAAATKAEMPRISDIVLDQLRKAGEAGTKARLIQEYIESTYGQEIHDKTVGMTLYRLAQENPPKVRREGHTWFIVPETVNPGGGTPGLRSMFD